MKTVLITGASKGIGRALSEKFMKEGWRVIAASKSGNDLTSTGILQVHDLDISSHKSITDFEKSFAGERIDLLINNAGVLLDEGETVILPELLRKTLEVNLIGTIDLTERFLPSLNAEAQIIFISSTAGSLELTWKGESHFEGHYPAYKISKAALNMYSVTLAKRLHSRGVFVSAIHPGWVRSEMGGEDADISPEESADDIYRFAIEKKSMSDTGKFVFRGEGLPW